jgi:hypothetical protein
MHAQFHEQIRLLLDIPAFSTRMREHRLRIIFAPTESSTQIFVTDQIARPRRFCWNDSGIAVRAGGLATELEAWLQRDGILQAQNAGDCSLGHSPALTSPARPRESGLE